MQALYHHTGCSFYCIDIPVTSGLKALKDADMMAEYNDLLIDFYRTADAFMKNGLNFPKLEVNFEQSIVAPATQFLVEMYLQTQDKQYLDAACSGESLWQSTRLSTQRDTCSPLGLLCFALNVSIAESLQI